MNDQLDFFDIPKPIQLRLFAYDNPLVLKFGRSFCQNIPKSAGVYRMRNLRGEVIYVGKAKDLRTRLRSYFYLRPENSSRKSVKMISNVETIDWELSNSEKAALLLENKKIRAHQPKYNKVNKEFNSYPYQHLKVESKSITFMLGFSADLKNFNYVFGCFRSRGKTYRVQLAMMRLLSIADLGIVTSFDVSARFFKACFGLNHSLEFVSFETSTMVKMIRRYYEGKSNYLCEFLEELLTKPTSDTFFANLIRADLDLLTDFYTSSSRYLKRVKKAVGFTQSVVAQHEIDDLSTNFAFTLP